MNITIGFGVPVSKERKTKGKSLLDCRLKNYTVIDIETTGLDSQYDEIIELAALKIVNNKIVDSFQSFVKPTEPIDDYITNLTGITNQMVENAPAITDIIDKYYNFLDDDILIGHNVNFDINFLYDIKELQNDFIDTLRISRRCIRDIKNHKLNTLTEYFNIDNKNEHRALVDCNITYYLFIKLQEMVIKDSSLLKSKRHHFSVKDISTDKIEFDEDNLFFHKYVAITGTLQKMQRKDAMQILADLGGYCQDGVNKETNYLILGNNDYNPMLRGSKSSKQLKAEKYKLKGQDIEIISENVFYDIINQ